MHLISLLEKEFSEIGAILTGDASDQSSFQNGVLLYLDGWALSVPLILCQMPSALAFGGSVGNLGWYLDWYAGRDDGCTQFPTAARSARASPQAAPAYLSLIHI